jgi:fibronectin type 3 domain-containing protein
MKYLLAVLGFFSLVVIVAKTAHAQSAMPPSVPTSVSASLLSTEQIYVSWNASNSTSSIIDGYYLYRNGAFVASIPGYTYYTDTPGAGAYEYTVAAYDVNGNISAQSTPTPAVNVIASTVPPTEPTGLTETPSSSSVALSWQPSTDNIGVIGYYISRNGVQIQTTDPITGTSYTDTGLVPGQTYTYSVTAYDALRNISGAAAIQATTIYDITPPTVPTQVKATVASPSEIDLSWQPSTDNIQLVGYNIYQNGTEIATLVGTTTSYADTGLSAQTNYTFNISAYDEVGNTSNESGPVSATTLPPDITPPSFPTYLTATAIDPTDVVLQWDPSTDADGVAGYNIYRGGTEITTVVGTTTYEDSGLATGTYYVYDVTAYDNAGNVSGPDYAAVTTPATMSAPSTPVVLPTPPATPTSTMATTPTTTSPVAPTPIVTPATPSFTFTTNLRYGIRSAAVTALQNFLISQNDLGASYNTGFYGSLTQAAVRQFQCVESIVCSGSPATTGWGSVGPRTRAALNSF